MKRLRKFVLIMIVMFASGLALLKYLTIQEEEDWKSRVSRVHPGMTRAQVEPLLPYQRMSPEDRRLKNFRLFLSGKPGRAIDLKEIVVLAGPKVRETYSVSPDWQVEIYYTPAGLAQGTTNLTNWASSPGDQVTGEVKLSPRLY